MYPDKPNNNKQKAVTGLVALIVIALLAGGASAYNAQQGSKNVATTVATSATPSTTGSTASSTGTISSSTSTTAATSGYKDGTYSASTSYYVPHGNEDIKVTLTVKGGVVTDSQIEQSGYSRESAMFQDGFASEYKNQVVGKSISGLQLSYVAGASDTTQAFDDAMDKIRSQAQA